jgi:hypothetical protein
MDIDWFKGVPNTPQPPLVPDPPRKLYTGFKGVSNTQPPLVPDPTRKVDDWFKGVPNTPQPPLVPDPPRELYTGYKTPNQARSFTFGQRAEELGQAARDAEPEPIQWKFSKDSQIGRDVDDLRKELGVKDYRNWLLELPIKPPPDREGFLYPEETVILTELINRFSNTRNPDILRNIDVLYTTAKNKEVKQKLLEIRERVIDSLEQESKSRIPDVVGTILPFDDFLREKNGIFECIIGRSGPLMEAINEYASMLKINDMIATIPTIKGFSELIKRWQTGSKHINENPLYSFQFYNWTTQLPPLTEAITLYRLYKTGIFPAPTEKTTMFQFGARSYSLSLSFCKYFEDVGSPTEDSAVYSRVDVLPGVNVLPMLNYDGADFQLPTEFEIALLPDARLHSFPVGGIPENNPSGLESNIRFPGSAAPMISPKIDFYFVVSQPGTIVDYTPYRSSRITIEGGGKQMLTDKDRYLVSGNQSIHVKMDKIMAAHKRKTKRKPKRKKTRKYKSIRY